MTDDLPAATSWYCGPCLDSRDGTLHGHVWTCGTCGWQLDTRQMGWT